MIEYNYITTDNLEEATHWIALSDDRYECGIIKKIHRFISSKLTRKRYSGDTRVILDIPYRLFDCRDDGELVIIDNSGHDIPLWLAHNGYFVKKVYKQR